MSRDWAVQLPLMPVTVYEGHEIQTMYRPFNEAVANTFVGDFRRFLEHYERPEVRERFEGAALVAYRAQQAREALQLVTWGLTDAARETFAPALDLLMALEHASSPYLSERGKQHVMEIPRRDTLPKRGPAHPELVDTLMSLAGQASQAIVLRAMQEMVADGDYETTEEALKNTWTQECCCATLYRFDDGHAQYDIVFNYVAISDRLSQSIECYTWDFLHPHLEVVFEVESENDITIKYGEDQGIERVDALTTQAATDLITVLSMIRDDAQDVLHSVSRSFI